MGVCDSVVKIMGILIGGPGKSWGPKRTGDCWATCCLDPVDNWRSVAGVTLLVKIRGYFGI